MQPRSMIKAKHFYAIMAFWAVFSVGTIANPSGNGSPLNKETPDSAPVFRITKGNNGDWSVCGPQDCFTTAIFCSHRGCLPTKNIVLALEAENGLRSGTNHANQVQYDKGGEVYDSNMKQDTQKVMEVELSDNAEVQAGVWANRPPKTDDQCQCWECPNCGTPTLARPGSTAEKAIDYPSSIMVVCNDNTTDCCPLWQIGQIGCPPLPLVAFAGIEWEVPNLSNNKSKSDFLELCGPGGCIHADELMDRIGPLVKQLLLTTNQKSEL